MKIKKISKRLNKEKIIILIDGWQSFESLFYFIRESVPEEYGYIQYAYTNDTLNSNPIKTKENFLHLVDVILNDIKRLKTKKKRSFYMYGQSLGGLFCMIVSDKIKIEKIRLIIPGSNLAEAFWHGEGTIEVKNEMVKKYNMTLPKLTKIWDKISPDHYLKSKSLKTEFNLTISKNDFVIPTKNGKNL